MIPEKFKGERLYDAEQSQQYHRKNFLGTVAHGVHRLPLEDASSLRIAAYQSDTLTIATILHILAEAAALGTIEWIYFEDGEAFLY